MRASTKQMQFDYWTGFKKYVSQHGELKGEATAYYFDQLSRKRDAIEAELGDKMVWHAPFGRRRRSIQRLRSADPWSRTGRTEQYRWLLASVDAMHRVLVPRVRALRVPR